MSPIFPIGNIKYHSDLRHVFQTNTPIGQTTGKLVETMSIIEFMWDRMCRILDVGDVYWNSRLDHSKRRVGVQTEIRTLQTMCANVEFEIRY